MIGRLGLPDIVVDGERLESRQRADQHLRAVAFDQFLRLGLGHGGLAGRIGGDDLDLAAGHLAAVLVHAQLQAFLHLPATGGQRA